MFDCVLITMCVFFFCSLRVSRALFVCVLSRCHSYFYDTEIINNRKQIYKKRASGQLGWCPVLEQDDYDHVYFAGGGEVSTHAKSQNW